MSSFSDLFQSFDNLSVIEGANFDLIASSEKTIPLRKRIFEE